MPTLVEKTGRDEIDGLLWGTKWDFTNLGVRFPQFAGEYVGYAQIIGFQPFNSTQINEILLTIGNLTAFTNLTFYPADTVGSGNLRFAMAEQIRYAFGDDEGLHVPGFIGSAEGNPPSPEFPDYSQGDTWYQAGKYQTPQFGNFARAAGLMHEVGHALGLKHGHNPQTTVGGRDFPALPSNVDSQEFTIMTYRTYVGQDFNVFPDGDVEYPWTYMQLDIAALQYMYGANFTANAGNTTYRFNETTGEFSIDGTGFGPSYNASILLTIWDGGGNDTYDFSNFTQDQAISLLPGAFSVFSNEQLAHLGDGNFARGNVANALLFEGDPRSLIENVVTGSGNDFVLGNSASNTLRGNGGNDTMFGGEGVDTLIGGDGNDFLDGGANPSRGGDVLLGGPGDDTYRVDHAFDFIDEGNFPEFAVHGFGGSDTIISTVDFFWDFYSIGERFVIDETVVDAGNDGVTGVGSVFSNEMVGHSGIDILFGRGGSDTYRPGDGVDWISLSTLGVPDAPGYTANGNNLVVVTPRTTGPFSYDIVFEFETGKDKIDLSTYGFDTTAQVMARGVNDGAGNSYFILGDGLDYLYMSGTTLAEIAAGDFIV